MIIISKTSERESVANPQLSFLLNEHEVAATLRVSVATVRRWRLLRQGPQYIKIGAAVRYRPECVSAFLESRPTGGGHPQQEAR